MLNSPMDQSMYFVLSAHIYHLNGWFIICRTFKEDGTWFVLPWRYLNHLVWVVATSRNCSCFSLQCLINWVVWRRCSQMKPSFLFCLPRNSIAVCNYCVLQPFFWVLNFLLPLHSSCFQCQENVAHFSKMKSFQGFQLNLDFLKSLLCSGSHPTLSFLSLHQWRVLLGKNCNADCDRSYFTLKIPSSVY